MVSRGTALPRELIDKRPLVVALRQGSFCAYKVLSRAVNKVTIFCSIAGCSGETLLGQRQAILRGTRVGMHLQ